MFSLRLLYILLPIFTIGCNTDPMATMPDFRIMLPDNGQIIQTGNLPKGEPTILIHFNSDCGDCQEEAEEIMYNMDKLKTVRIYFVSIQDTAHINLFRDYYKFGNYPNVTVGRDLDTSMVKHFHTLTTPLLALYDKNKNIKAVFEGKADMNKLLLHVDEL